MKAAPAPLPLLRRSEEEPQSLLVSTESPQAELVSLPELPQSLQLPQSLHAPESLSQPPQSESESAMSLLLIDESSQAHTVLRQSQLHPPQMGSKVHWRGEMVGCEAYELVGKAVVKYALILSNGVYRPKAAALLRFCNLVPVMSDSVGIRQAGRALRLAEL
jgi:hypothetical protein